MYYYPIAKFKCSSFPGEAAPCPRCRSSVPGHPSMPGLVQPGASRCGPSTGPRSSARRVWLSFRDPSLTPPLSALPASAPPPSERVTDCPSGPASRATSGFTPGAALPVPAVGWGWLGLTGDSGV